jgi:hypothetical protein
MKGQNAGPLAGGLMSELSASEQKDDATSGSDGRERRTSPPRNGFGERLDRYLGRRDGVEECSECGSTARDAWMHEGGSDVRLKCVACSRVERVTEGDR